MYSGIYTKSSQGYTAELGQYTNGELFDFQVSVEIYNDYIKVLSSCYNYIETSGEWRIYGGNGTGFGTIEYYYVDPSTYNMKFVVQSFNSFTGSYMNTTYAMAKGDVIFQKQYNSNSGYSSGESSYSSGGSSRSSSSRSGNSGSTNTRRSCTVCQYHVGKCGVCKGTGNVTKSAYGTSTTVSCRNCGGNGRCPICGGDGWR